MKQSIPYDSPKATSICGAITAIMTGESYATSAEMAAEIGPFPCYSRNRESMLRVMRNHRRAAYSAPQAEYEGLTILPTSIQPEHCPPAMLLAARRAWDRALNWGRPMDSGTQGDRHRADGDHRSGHGLRYHRIEPISPS